MLPSSGNADLRRPLVCVEAGHGFFFSKVERGWTIEQSGRETRIGRASVVVPPCEANASNVTLHVCLQNYPGIHLWTFCGS
jgi:hypothetical protein